MKNFVSVVVPVLNEIDVLPIFIERINLVAQTLDDSADFEIIFVDDGSNDGSTEFISQLCEVDTRIKLIVLSRNFGHQVAIAAGMDYASGDAVITIDCDLQDPPEVIPHLIAAWMSGFDIVLAKRKSRAGETKFKKLTASLFYRFLSRIANTELSQDVADFRLLTREAIDALRALNEPSPYFRGLVNWIGFESIEIEYDRDPRFAGHTKYTFRKMVRLAINGVTSFSEKPLQMMSYIGIFLVTLAFSGAGITLISKYLNPDRSVPGYVTLLIVILFLGGIQLFSLGTIGIYISVIVQNSRNRPRYVIQKKKSNHPLLNKSQSS